jgi:hypothetical protein
MILCPLCGSRRFLVHTTQVIQMAVEGTLDGDYAVQQEHTEDSTWHRLTCRTCGHDTTKEAAEAAFMAFTTAPSPATASQGTGLIRTPVVVTAQATHEQVTAEHFSCGDCGCQAFILFQIDGQSHPHVQCLACNVSFCFMGQCTAAPEESAHDPSTN